MLMFSVIVLFSVMTTLFLFTTNPSLMIVSLVLVSLLVGFILSMHASSWMFFAVVLLFTGGMMVLFSYMLTLVSPSKVTLQYSSFSMAVLWVALVFVGVLWTPVSESFTLIGNLYAPSQSGFLFFLAIYLFVVLIAVVKLAVSFLGALKSFASNEF